MTLPDKTDTIATLGGILANAEPVTDATTDLDADADNKARANNAMMSRTACQALRRFTGHATTPADPGSGLVHRALWGSAVGVKPPVTKGGTGIYLVTWAATQNDELGVSHSLNLEIARAWVEVTGATLILATARITAPNIVEVRVYTMAGALTDAVASNIVVQAW